MKHGLISGINVTPLVDIMLVLLVVFMVTTTVVTASAVPLDLPRASHSEAVSVVFSVALPATGPVTVDGQSIGGDEDLERRARQALARASEVRALIDADGAVPYRRVLHTLDVLKGAGIARIAFGAQPQDERHR